MGIPLSALTIGHPADARHVVGALERAMCTPIYKCINDDPTILAELQSSSWDLAFHCRPATQGGEAFSAGDVLKKPYRRAVLQQAVRATLDGPSAARPQTL